MHEVTRILSAIEQGDPHAAEQLLPLVYDELRRLAAEKMAQEKPGQTLQATALVHEAYIRLVDVRRPSTGIPAGISLLPLPRPCGGFSSSSARRQARAKHGGGWQCRYLIRIRSPLGDVTEDIEALDAALDRLAEADAQSAELVEAALFRRPDHPEAAEALGISAAERADSIWAYARAWLRQEIEGR